MATCPRCGGFLGEHHRCGRRRLLRIGATALAMLVGGAVSPVALYAVIDRPEVPTVGLGAVAGMLIGRAVWTVARR
jgi:hypothetical protein